MSAVIAFSNNQHTTPYTSIYAVESNNHYGYRPLEKGDNAPAFSFKTKQMIARYLIYGSLVNTTNILLQDLLDYQQPLVLAFYSSNQFSEKSITELESLHADVKVMGGKLIVITNNYLPHFKHFLKTEAGLNVYYDKDNSIAEAFGLYNYFNPLSNWVAGIDNEKDVLPAFYVVAANKQIIFKQVDYNMQLFNNANFANEPFIRNMLTTVYHSHHQFSTKHVLQRYVS